MFLNIVNPNVNKRDKLIQIINNYNKNKQPSPSINITLDGLYCEKYNNSKTKCIFINYCRDNYKTSATDNEHNIKHFYFITFDTMNPQLTYMPNISENKQNALNLLFNITKFNYNINDNGHIYIIMNNLNGIFLSKMNKEEIKQKLIDLIIIINQYSNKKIYLRPHLKDLMDNKIKFYKNIRKLFTNVFIDVTAKINIKNIYCVFIQNTKFMFHFASCGVPMYNSNFVDYTYFPEICINDMSIINKLSDNITKLPDIKKFMYKYYKFIYTETELEHPNFLNNLVSIYVNPDGVDNETPIIT